MRKRNEENNLDYRLLHVPYICLEMSIEHYNKIVVVTVFTSGEGGYW